MNCLRLRINIWRCTNVVKRLRCIFRFTGLYKLQRSSHAFCNLYYKGLYSFPPRADDFSSVTYIPSPSKLKPHCHGLLSLGEYQQWIALNYMQVSSANLKYFPWHSFPIQVSSLHVLGFHNGVQTKLHSSLG